MKKLAAILLIVLAGCGQGQLSKTKGYISIVDWMRYKQECYNDSIPQAVKIGTGQIIDSVVVFNIDTVWHHKQPTTEGFFIWLENEK